MNELRLGHVCKVEIVELISEGRERISRSIGASSSVFFLWKIFHLSNPPSTKPPYNLRNPIHCLRNGCVSWSWPAEHMADPMMYNIWKIGSVFYSTQGIHSIVQSRTMSWSMVRFRSMQAYDLFERVDCIAMSNSFLLEWFKLPTYDHIW